MGIFKNVMFVVLGVLLAVGIYCLTVAIGCAVNGISFQQQIVEWFGPAREVTEKVVNEVSTSARLLF